VGFKGRVGRLSRGNWRQSPGSVAFEKITVRSSPAKIRVGRHRGEGVELTSSALMVITSSLLAHLRILEREAMFMPMDMSRSHL